MLYQIHLEGKLEPSIGQWFEDMSISFEADNTVLQGELIDQSALHGLLKRVRDLGLTILKVERVGISDLP